MAEALELARPARPSRRSVTSRVTASYLLVTAIFSLMAIWNLLAQRRAAGEAELLRSGYLPLTLALRSTVLHQELWNAQLNHVTTATNPADKRLWFDAMLARGRPQDFAQVRQTLLRAFGDSEGDPAEAASDWLTAARSIEQFLARDKELIAALFAALEGRRPEEAQAVRDKLVRRSSEARQKLVSLEAGVTAQIDSLLEEARGRERRAWQLVVLSAALTVIVGLVMAVRTRRLLQPLGAVTERAKVVAQGDLTPRRVVATDDEIGELALTFEAMVSAIDRANRELLKTERLAAIGKMAAQVTHEIRNPLSSLALNLELLEDELARAQAAFRHPGASGDTAFDSGTATDSGEEANNLLRAVTAEVERLTQLTEKYLSLARRSRPDRQEEDLGELVTQAIDATRAELTRAGIDLVLRVQPDLPAALVDEAQIRQVLLNLVRNAREAMSSGGAIHVSVSAPTPVTCQIEVADSGPGMPPDVRRQIFEPFFTTKGQGTGLGLAITREIVEAHGGDIQVTANEPHGTRFVIRLPLAGEVSTGAGSSGSEGSSGLAGGWSQHR